MSLIFLALSIVLILSALGVVLFQNALHSALALIVNLIAVACVFAALNAHFLAVIQVIVYGGAIMVLVLFVLMLLNVKDEDRRFTSVFQLIFSSILGGCFIALVYHVNAGFWSNRDIPMIPVDNIATEGSVEAIGMLLFTKYLFPFEAASLLIMSAIVGATMMAKSRKKKSDVEKRLAGEA